MNRVRVCSHHVIISLPNLLVSTELKPFRLIHSLSSFLYMCSYSRSYINNEIHRKKPINKQIRSMFFLHHHTNILKGILYK